MKRLGIVAVGLALVVGLGGRGLEIFACPGYAVAAVMDVQSGFMSPVLYNDMAY
jgi:hypothetical protein